MHTKRIAAGYGKKPKWITTPKGPHPKAESIPLMMVVRDILGYADNAREARKIITEGMVLVDKVPRTDPVYGVGLMDVVELPKADKCFRVMPTKRGCELKQIDAKESAVKPCKVTGKRIVAGGKTQISLHDGTNLLVEKGGDYRTKDTLLMELPGRKVKETFKFEKGAFGLVVRGRHIGESGVIGEITAGDLVQKSLTDIGGFRTMTDYIFVVGKDKPAITV
jgi:small subunit ribosomal protein S4e